LESDGQKKKKTSLTVFSGDCAGEEETVLAVGETPKRDKAMIWECGSQPVRLTGAGNTTSDGEESYFEMTAKKNLYMVRGRLPGGEGKESE